MTLRQPPMSMHYGKPIRQSVDTDEGAGSRSPVAVQLAGLVLLLVLVRFHGIWSVRQLLVPPLLLILPGVILLRTIRVHGASVANQPIYVLSASSLVLTFSGLATDQNAWLYASCPNVINGIARSVSGYYPAIHAFPARFLDSNFNIVHTNGTSEVFHL